MDNDHVSSLPTILDEKLRTIASLPTLPTVVERLIRLLQDPQVSAEEIGKAISSDQALASKVLKLVNSAFYGFPGRIGTITHAVVILGFSTVKNIILTSTIFDFFRRPGTKHSAFDMEKFWFHSLACGAASLSLAKHSGYADKEECFIGGLIHDIGKVVLYQYLPGEFCAVADHARSKDVLFLDAENTLLGITHQDIGALLAERWNLPIDLREVIRYHHQPSLCSPMTAIVHAADIMVRAMDYGNGGDEKIPLMSDEVWKSLGLRATTLKPILASIDDEVQRASGLLDMI